jgi:hypothetical protein
LKQTRQAIEFRGRSPGLFSALLHGHVAAQVFDRRLDGRQRCSQIVAERRQERRGQIRPLLHQFRGSSLVATFDRLSSAGLDGC